MIVGSAVAAENTAMDPFWTLASVVVGAVLAGVFSWWKDHAVQKRTERAERRAENLNLCVSFLEAIDAEGDRVNDHDLQYGMLPGDMGHDEVLSPSRQQLIALELRCPREVFAAAQALTLAIEAWAYRTTEKWKHFDDARAHFVRTVQKSL